MLIACFLASPTRRRGGDGSPSWWPEFEREFRAYVEATASRRGTAPGRPATAEDRRDP